MARMCAEDVGGARRRSLGAWESFWQRNVGVSQMWTVFAAARSVEGTRNAAQTRGRARF
jgi:hypothetical protein